MYSGISLFVTIKKIICVSCKNIYECGLYGGFAPSCRVNKQDYVLHYTERSRISYTEIINVRMRKAR